MKMHCVSKVIFLRRRVVKARQIFSFAAGKDVMEIGFWVKIVLGVPAHRMQKKASLI